MANGDKRPTQGGDALSRCADSHAEIAAEVGVDKSLVTRWISGARKPTDPQVAKLEKLYGIPAEAWKTPASPPKRVTKAKGEPTKPDPRQPSSRREPDEGDGAVDESVPDPGRLHRFIRDGMRELETSELPANKRAETLKKLVDAKVALDRSTGENALTMTRIAQHPEFQRVVRLITEAIATHPEVLGKVLDVLRANP